MSPSDDAAAQQRAGALLRGAMPAPAFRAGFADRTMAAVTASRAAAAAPAPEAVRAIAMRHHFRIVAAAAALLIAALGVHNTVIARSTDASLMEAAIGLQPVSADALLSVSTDTYQ